MAVVFTTVFIGCLNVIKKKRFSCNSCHINLIPLNQGVVGGPVQHGHLQGQHEEPVHVERHERAVGVQRAGDNHAQGRQALGRVGAQARAQHVRAVAGSVIHKNYYHFSMKINMCFN